MDIEKIRPMLISVIVALVILIIAGSVWWVTRPKVEVAPSNQNIATKTPEVLAPIDVPPPSAERIEAERNYPLGLKQLAQSFAERYGSYSTDNPSKNLLDLKPLMTTQLQGIIDQQINQPNATTSVAYEGISTLAVRSEVVSNTATAAEVVVQTQRIRTTDDGQTSTFYQAINLTFTKINDTWLVDSVRWQ